MSEYLATYYTPEKLEKAWAVIQRDFLLLQNYSMLK